MYHSARVRKDGPHGLRAVVPPAFKKGITRFAKDWLKCENAKSYLDVSVTV